MCFLKDRTLSTLQTDLVGKLYRSFDPHDPEALAERLVQLAEDPALWDQLRQAGLARARSFRWHDTARRTLEVYRKAAAS